ncbi:MULTISPECIES: hypothetical protein [Rossellomorea]|uniref:hypothetical protein n=1 Tax=Rossellomorea TaxID=2837508 RepID=UPI000559305A|nr:hypothetical protein [Rossellomorea vietnamensis]
MRQFRVFICLLLLMSFGCTVFASERGTIIVYKGESENWSIISNVKIVGNNVEYKYTVKYKGENIDSIGRVTYRLDSIAGSLGGASKLDATSNNSRAGKIIGRGAGGNIDLVSKTTTIVAKVEWNNKLESFELKKQ